MKLSAVALHRGQLQCVCNATQRNPFRAPGILDVRRSLLSLSPKQPCEHIKDEQGHREKHAPLQTRALYDSQNPIVSGCFLFFRGNSTVPFSRCDS